MTRVTPQDRSVDSGLTFSVYGNGVFKAQFNLPSPFIPAANPGKSGHAIGFGGATGRFYVDDVIAKQGPFSSSPTPKPTPVPTATPTPYAGEAILFSDTFETGIIGETLDKKPLGDQLGGVLTDAKWVGNESSQCRYIDSGVSGLAGQAYQYNAANVYFTANPANSYTLEGVIGGVTQDTFSNLFAYHDPKESSLWTGAGLICRFVRMNNYYMAPMVEILYRNTRNENVAGAVINGSKYLNAGDYDSNGDVPVKWFFSYMDVTTTSTVTGTVYTNGNRKYDFTTGSSADVQVSPAGQGVGFMNVYGTGWVDNFKFSQVSPSPTPTPSPTPYPPEAGRAPILFIASSNPPDFQESIILLELARLGYPVTVKTPADIPDEAAATSLANGAGLVLISPSASTTKLGSKFKSVDTPVMTCNSTLYPSMKMGYYGMIAVSSDINISAPADPLAAGLNGTVRMYNVLSDIYWGYPGPGATTVATQPDDSSHAAIFYYTAGAQMVDGFAAPANRVGFFMTESAPSVQTSEAWSLFDAAVNWAFQAPVPPSAPTNPNPPDGAVNVPVSTLLSWNNPAFASAGKEKAAGLNASVMAALNGKIDPSTGKPFMISPRRALAPKTAGAAGGAVLWDITHGVLAGYDPSGEYSTLAMLLANKGFSMETTSAGIDNISLASYDILVVSLGSAWDSQYSPAEVSAIQAFVNAGGGLLILGDNPNCPNFTIAPVAQAFGVNCGISDIYSFSNYASNVIFEGCSNIYYPQGGELSTFSPAEIIAWTPENRGAVAVASQAGRVVVAGDINFCQNGYIFTESNQRFAENIFDYLSGGLSRRTTYDVYFGTTNPPTSLIHSALTVPQCYPNTLAYSNQPITGRLSRRILLAMLRELCGHLRLARSLRTLPSTIRLPLTPIARCPLAM